MSNATTSTNHMRMLRVPLIIDLLRDQPLPAEVVILRLQKRLSELGLPVVEERRIKADLAWILKHFWTTVIERISRSGLAETIHPSVRALAKDCSLDALHSRAPVPWATVA